MEYFGVFWSSVEKVVRQRRLVDNFLEYFGIFGGFFLGLFGFV